MPRTCTVCGHSKRRAIEKAIVDGQTYRDVAKSFGLVASSVQRHMNNCVKPALNAAVAARDESNASNLLERLEGLQRTAQAIMDRALQGDQPDNPLALSAMRRMEHQLLLMGRLVGEIAPPQIVIHQAPEWLTLRDQIMQSLRPYPDALRAVVAALRPPAQIDGGKS